MLYIPRVKCLKCNEDAKVVRRNTAKERFLEVSHHGETVRIDFATEPNTVIELW